MRDEVDEVDDVVFAPALVVESWLRREEKRRWRVGRVAVRVDMFVWWVGLGWVVLLVGRMEV